MERVSLVIGLFLLLPTSANADPRAMMMQGAWMQSRQPRMVKPSAPITIGVHKAPTPRGQVPKVSALKKPAKPRSAKKTPAPKEEATSVTQPAPEVVVPAAAPKAPRAARPAEQGGFFGHLMLHLGRVTGSALKNPRAWLSRLFGAARPGKEKRVIRYGSLPVGLLLTPLRNHALNIRLTPQGLIDMRRARLISDTEFQLLMGQLRLGL